MFAGKNVLIYGGGRGIGRACALEFARRGARLALADMDTDGAAKTAEEIEISGGAAVSMRCDVTQDQSVRDAAEAAERGIGAIDIVMNNVGKLVTGYPEDVPISEWQRILDLNLMPIVRSNEVFLKRMIARGSGHIVNTASFAGLFPYGANRMPYVAAKASVVALTESMALHLIPKGVNVSCFCPGPVMTNVMEGVKNWSPDAPMLGPGSQFVLKTAEEAATALADGMEAGRILIPTDELALEEVRRHGADPDAFIRDKLAQFAAGDFGLITRKNA